jgi:hypothetical protein
MLSAVTQADGSFIFSNLLRGTYTITETAPVPYTAELADPGTVNGVVDGNAPNPTVINNIFIGPSQTGINYDFALTLVNTSG